MIQVEKCYNFSPHSNQCNKCRNNNLDNNSSFSLSLESFFFSIAPSKEKNKKIIRKKELKEREMSSISSAIIIVINLSVISVFDVSSSETRSRKPIPILTKSDHICGKGEYKCMNGLCILAKWKCDNYDDCGDWSDEYNCPIETTFPNGTSTNGQQSGTSINGQSGQTESEQLGTPGSLGSVPIQKRMGKVGIVPSGVEGRRVERRRVERRRVKGCPLDRFDCGNNGQCITKDFICDSDPDCANDRDELDCPDRTGTEGGQRTKVSTEQSGERKVSKGQRNHNTPMTPPSLISLEHAQLKELDNPFDAKGQSSPSSLTCREGIQFKCIPNSHSNPMDLVTNTSVHHSQSSQLHSQSAQGSGGNLKEVCFPITSICDGRIDCTDGSDESDCTGNDVYCGLDAYTCSNYQCIKDTKVCDRVKDCFDGSDEENCIYCTDQQFACRYGSSLLIRLLISLLIHLLIS